jgi:hypothetical protein
MELLKNLAREHCGILGLRVHLSEGLGDVGCLAWRWEKKESHVLDE